MNNLRISCSVASVTSALLALTSALATHGAEPTSGLGAYQAIVERNPFGAVAVKVPTDGGNDDKVWAKDLTIVGVVSSVDSNNLALVIEEKTSKLVYYCAVGESVKEDIVLDRLEQVGDNIRAYLKKGNQSATLEFEAKTASATSATASPPPMTPGARPPMTPGARSPIPIRRPPVPIRR
jgi:hypothetical protein